MGLSQPSSALETPSAPASDTLAELLRFGNHNADPAKHCLSFGIDTQTDMQDILGPVLNRVAALSAQQLACRAQQPTTIACMSTQFQVSAA